MFRRMVYSFLALLVAATGIAYGDAIITGSKPYTFTPGTVISSSQVNANYDYIINQVNTNAAKNGVNSSITALLGLTTPLAPASGGSSVYVATSVGGTANAITVTASQPNVTSYSLSNRNIVVFKATNQNTATATLNVNSTGAITLKKQGTNGLLDLQNGDILVNNVYHAFYDGTNYVLVNNPQLFGQTSTFASASTVDLGLAQSHNVLITGTTTITSFGSTAFVSLPIYLLRFDNALTITFNATSMITPSGGDISSTTGGMMIVEYLGSGNWRINAFIPAINTDGIESVNGLVIKNNAGIPNTQIDVAKTKAILCNTTDYCVRTGNATLTINGATTGANGLDTGSLANNTWYYIYIIHTGSAAAGLISTSATTPTMPAGYIFKYRVGAIKTGGAATFHRITQRGNEAQYTVTAGSVTSTIPIMVSGVNTANVPTAIDITPFVPATAVKIKGSLIVDRNAGVGVVAPNNAYAATIFTNPPPVTNFINVDREVAQMYDFVIESSLTTGVYYSSDNVNVLVTCLGWKDAVNAN